MGASGGVSGPNHGEDVPQENRGGCGECAEKIREAFWMAGADLARMLYVSPAYEEIWGRSRESLYSNPHCRTEAIHAADREKVHKAVASRMTPGVQCRVSGSAPRRIDPLGA
ncbi:MAG TPA: PAS domain-containing protein [Syntrophobacteraceae bacterium]|nr:PAS domain-containing protein [Syntrophobacteraceae bacterium]